MADQSGRFVGVTEEGSAEVTQRPSQPRYLFAFSCDDSGQAHQFRDLWNGR